MWGALIGIAVLWTIASVPLGMAIGRIIRGAR